MAKREQKEFLSYMVWSDTDGFVDSFEDKAVAQEMADSLGSEHTHVYTYRVIETENRRISTRVDD